MLKYIIFLLLSHATYGQIKFGSDLFIEKYIKQFEGKSVSLVVNQASFTASGNNVLDSIMRSDQLKVRSIMAPEHGFDGIIKAGVNVTDIKHPKYKIPIHSLYGETRKPTNGMMAGIDAVVFDLQDIGSRSYTYISTLGNVMEAAQELGIEVIVLDRPNPLGGNKIEGPMLDQKFKSFVSMYNIPYIHGFTIGELARWINKEYLKKPVKLHIIKMEGWTRDSIWSDYNIVWRKTSPNIPDIHSVYGYAFTGLLGEIGISNGAYHDPNHQYGRNDKHGRLPFQIIADALINPLVLKNFINSSFNNNIVAEEYQYYPASGKWKSQLYRGIKLDYQDVRRVNLTEGVFKVLWHFKKTNPRLFKIKMGRAHSTLFDKINGGDIPRKTLMQKEENDTNLFLKWKKQNEQWKIDRKKYLLYD